MIFKGAPLVHQLVQEILAQLDNGHLLRHGGSLPSEAELSQQFGVSRATVRDALGKLELAGVIIRRQGVGTFVNRLLSSQPGSLQCWIDEAAGFSDTIEAAGHRADCRVLLSEVRKAGPQAGDLQVAPSSEVLCVERLYSSDGSPIIHSMGYFPIDLVLPERRHALVTGYDVHLSTYQFLEQYCGCAVHHQMSVTQAVIADDYLSGLLGCTAGDPLLCVTEIGYDAEMAPLFCGLNHHRADIVSFMQVRRPVMQIVFPKTDAR